MSARGAVVDTGLQAERTLLAWSRTALALGGVGGFILHAGWSRGAVIPSAGGLLLVSLALVLYAAGVVRYRLLIRRAAAGHAVAAPWALRIVVVSVALVTPAALALLLD